MRGVSVQLLARCEPSAGGVAARDPGGYRKDSPGWDVVIDVDALAAAEDENWV